MKFNINDNVRVKLTAFGFKVYAAHMAPYEMGPHIPPKVDSEGYSTFQLWYLMSVFGPVIFMGNKLPFDTDILL